MPRQCELGQNGKHPRRKSGASPRFRKGADDEGAGFRDLIEIREQLDLVMIGTQNVGLERVIVLGGCDPGIGVSRLVTGGGDFALFV